MYLYVQQAHNFYTFHRGNEMTQTTASYKIAPCLYTSKARYFPKCFQNDYFIWHLHQCYEVNRVSNSISEGGNWHWTGLHSSHTANQWVLEKTDFQWNTYNVTSDCGAESTFQVSKWLAQNWHTISSDCLIYCCYLGSKAILGTMNNEWMGNNEWVNEWVEAWLTDLGYTDRSFQKTVRNWFSKFVNASTLFLYFLI